MTGQFAVGFITGALVLFAAQTIGLLIVDIRSTTRRERVLRQRAIARAGRRAPTPYNPERPVP